METTVQCESSNGMVKVQVRAASSKQVKSNKICPIEGQQRGVMDQPSHTLQSSIIKTTQGNVFLTSQSNKFKLESLIHVRPIYSLGTFLTKLDVVGNQCSFTVNKSSSFPCNSYEIVDKNNKDSSFKLSSNFIGSQYNLQKGGVSYLTMVFDLGCGSKCRTFSIYTLREEAKWSSLEGTSKSSDLGVLYSKGKNYQQIAKYSNLEPMFNEMTGYSCLSFSRKTVVPCVQNTIVCSLNGQRNLEMIKIDRNDSLFEVSFLKSWGIEKVLAFVIASCDFKLGIQ